MDLDKVELKFSEWFMVLLKTIYAFTPVKYIITGLVVGVPLMIALRNCGCEKPAPFILNLIMACGAAAITNLFVWGLGPMLYKDIKDWFDEHVMYQYRHNTELAKKQVLEKADEIILDQRRK